MHPWPPPGTGSDHMLRHSYRIKHMTSDNDRGLIAQRNIMAIMPAGKRIVISSPHDTPTFAERHIGGTNSPNVHYLKGSPSLPSDAASGLDTMI